MMAEAVPDDAQPPRSRWSEVLDLYWRVDQNKVLTKSGDQLRRHWSPLIRAVQAITAAAGNNAIADPGGRPGERAMMGLPRYRHQPFADLQPLVLEPLIRNRIAIAHPKGTDRTAFTGIAGFAIWASVSQEVDLKIRKQIKTGTFRVRLKPED